MVGMHIHIIPNRNSTPAVLLRESYRVGGNVRKRTLANLSKLPMDAVDAIRRILKGEKLVSVEVAFKIVENGSRHHGHVDAVLSAMRQLGFEKLVGSRHSPERDLVVAMVVARILEASSPLIPTISVGTQPHCPKSLGFSMPAKRSLCRYGLGSINYAIDGHRDDDERERPSLPRRPADL